MSNKLAEIGKIYYCLYKDYWMIGKCLSETDVEGNCKRCGATLINAEGKLSTMHNWCYDEPERSFREATDDEIAWLNACINAGMYIDKPIYNRNSYSIFN